MENKIQHQLVIPKNYANKRLDQALVLLLPEYSRTQIQEWIAKGFLLVNHNPAKAKNKVHGGEMITLAVTRTPSKQWIAQNIPLNIVYEDNALIVVNKPQGLVVHPGAGNRDQTLLNALLHYAKELQLLPRAGILHRLDKNTSGLLVIAKTAQALTHLNNQLKKRKLLREYQAIVYGHLISGGKVDAPIGRNPHERTRRAVIETGKKAITHYRVAEKYRAHTRLKIRLETGRTHQIRVHMAHIHHPIVGDNNYGGRLRLTKGMSTEAIEALRKFKRQALHAYALGFTHPETEEWLHFESDLPDDMAELIKILRADLQNKGMQK